MLLSDILSLSQSPRGSPIQSLYGLCWVLRVGLGSPHAWPEMAPSSHPSTAGGAPCLPSPLRTNDVALRNELLRILHHQNRERDRGSSSVWL